MNSMKASISRGGFAWSRLPIILAFVVFLEPAYFRQSLASVDTVFNVLQVVFASIVIFEYARTCKIRILSVLIVLYYAIVLSATLVNDGEAKSVIVQCVTFIPICMLLELVMRRNSQDLFSILLPILECYVLINAASVLLFPDGLYKTNSAWLDTYYFLGYRNQMINFILPCLCLEFLNVEYGKQSNRGAWIRTAFFLLISVYSIFSAGSGASTVLIVSLGVFFIIKGVVPSAVLNFRICLIIVAILFFSIVIFRMQYLFFGIIDSLGRDPTLTGRVYIWDKTLYLIQHNWLLGYGVENVDYRIAQYRSLGFRSVDLAAGLHAHDRILEVLFRGGVPLLTCYLAMLLCIEKRLYRYRGRNSAKILSFCIFMYLIGMLTEYYDYSPLFFALFFMAFNVDLFESNLVGTKTAEYERPSNLVDERRKDFGLDDSEHEGILRI